MKSILIKSARIVNKESSHHGKEVNVQIKNGKISYIGDDAPNSDETIEAQGMILSAGWFDLQAVFADPGHEHKEDLLSGAAAAAAGGFTGVALLPNNKPVTQGKNDVKYLKSNNQDTLTQVYPIAAVTLDCKGVELTEMIDLHVAGAIAFSDGLRPIWHTDILLKSLQYLQKFDGVLINRPEDIHLNMFGVMNEGISSTQLGMKGMPTLSEELIVQRDLELLAYAGGKLHLSNISSAKSINLIKEAKKKGLQVTCDMAAYQLDFDDEDLMSFDTNLKVNPPFRTAKENKALFKALKEGVIDVLVSAHNPQDEDSKKLEFDLADFGINSLQTVAHNIATLAKDIELDTLIEKVTAAPRKILGLSNPVIEEGENAELTLFSPDYEWKLAYNTNFSKSENSPYWNKAIKGKAIATFNNDKSYIHKQ
ncbi:dihydroorotase [Fulvivirga sediminis]|uniref:Dihydroorotase n=1 Tax=Fulvivirga sediminis TaxID=2803949 RepID=A0A937FAN4_9BACT|nr:dihydroorotase [Fulvivirga sediminis]MBL3658087.1 dihydroorotase [Fulvivirga sediminis]